MPRTIANAGSSLKQSCLQNKKNHAMTYSHMRFMLNNSALGFKETIMPVASGFKFI
jgi:hypothetical protein